MFVFCRQNCSLICVVRNARYKFGSGSYMFEVVFLKKSQTDIIIKNLRILYY